MYAINLALLELEFVNRGVTGGGQGDQLPPSLRYWQNRRRATLLLTQTKNEKSDHGQILDM